MFIWFFLLFFNFIFCLDPPLWIILQKRQKFKEYDECLKKLYLKYKNFGYNKKYISTYTVESSMVNLNCFEWYNFLNINTINFKRRLD